MNDTRRSFLSRLGAGATAFGAVLGVGRSAADAQSTAPSQSPTQGTSAWQPARHAEDDWFDQVPAKHRLFLDTTTVEAFGSALRYANNYFSASRSAAYELTDADSALVICVRHQSTPFAFTDAMWAKYGAALGGHAVFIDPKTKAAPTVNVFQASGYNEWLTSRGVTVDAVLRRGLRIAVCQLATRAIASEAAQKTGGKTDDIYKELTENRIANSRMVPAGIIAVNRAQERGYTFSYAS